MADLIAACRRYAELHRADEHDLKAVYAAGEAICEVLDDIDRRDEWQPASVVPPMSHTDTQDDVERYGVSEEIVAETKDGRRQRVRHCTATEHMPATWYTRIGDAVEVVRWRHG